MKPSKLLMSKQGMEFISTKTKFLLSSSEGSILPKIDLRQARNSLKIPMTEMLKDEQREIKHMKQKKTKALKNNFIPGTS